MGSTIATKSNSWRERLAGYPKLPDVKPIPERMQQRHGPGTIVTPSPREVDEAMKRVREGRLVTVFGIGQQLAREHGATLKYPGGLDELMQRLESEGHTVVQRGRRYFVEDFETKHIER